MRALMFGAVAALSFVATAQVKDGGYRDIGDMITVSGTQAWMVMPPKLIISGEIESVQLSDSRKFALVRYHRRTEKDLVKIAESNVEPLNTVEAVVEIASGRVNEVFAYPDQQADHIETEFIDNSEYVYIREYKSQPKSDEDVVLINAFLMPALGKPSKVEPFENSNLIFVPSMGQFANLISNGNSDPVKYSVIFFSMPVWPRSEKFPSRMAVINGGYLPTRRDPLFTPLGWTPSGRSICKPGLSFLPTTWSSMT
ncbi:MAG: hypothetical protein KDC26_06930 [Armatimonadetes bacterium]|nr:hypothetical protein [Armatimonadota bacterium]